jgi:VWFA-related protein
MYPKKLIFVVAVSALSLGLLAQQLSHDTTVINIEVPVRVFEGNTFVDDLTLGDFEVYENGKPQKIEAVYLIKKTNIEREETEATKEEARKKFAPEASRYFVLAFILTEYLPKVAEAVDYFLAQVILPGDTLNVVTPLKTYNMKPDVFERVPKEEIKRQLIGKLRQDIMSGYSEYLDHMKELESAAMARDVEGYQRALTRLSWLRYIDQEELENFAGYLKGQTGQKYVFLFYQQETIPKLETATSSEEMAEAEMATRGGVPGDKLPDSYMRDSSFDVDGVKQIFSDSSISIHFLYITKDINDRIDVGNMGSRGGMRFEDKSEGIFSAFKEMAEATGGVTDSSANISSALKKAGQASENYYLLYYSPKGYKGDGQFRNIKVKVKNKDYRITHRAGYFAN